MQEDDSIEEQEIESVAVASTASTETQTQADDACYASHAAYFLITITLSEKKIIFVFISSILEL